MEIGASQKYPSKSIPEKLYPLDEAFVAKSRGIAIELKINIPFIPYFDPGKLVWSNKMMDKALKN